MSMFIMNKVKFSVYQIKSANVHINFESVQNII